MASDLVTRTRRILDSIQKVFSRFSSDFAEALAKLDETTIRITALGEIHSRLAGTLMNAMGIMPLVGSPLPFLPHQVEAISSTERAVMMSSGLLRPVLRSLRSPCRDIVEAIRTSEESIFKVTDRFDVTEMSILAKELGKDPDRVLGSDEQEACRNKVSEWVLKLKDILSESED